MDFLFQVLLGISIEDLRGGDAHPNALEINLRYFGQNGIVGHWSDDFWMDYGRDAPTWIRCCDVYLLI